MLLDKTRLLSSDDTINDNMWLQLTDTQSLSQLVKIINSYIIAVCYTSTPNIIIIMVWMKWKRACGWEINFKEMTILITVEPLQEGRSEIRTPLY